MSEKWHPYYNPVPVLKLQKNFQGKKRPVKIVTIRIILIITKIHRDFCKKHDIIRIGRHEDRKVKNRGE